MIQATELRIGNYVENEGVYKQVCSLEDGTIYKSDNPIQITPDILDTINEFFVDNMNYNPDKNNYSTCVDEDTYLHINSKTGETRIGGCEHFAEVEFGTVSTTFFIPDTKYLHQLQNLIYSLSGQELTFKTTTHEQK